jgi:hypothetical protein
MQQPEAFQRELRATYAAIVAESFDRARHCLTNARIARQDGHGDSLREMLRCVQVLRMAAAEWRKRVRHIAPVLVCLVGFLHGCAHRPVWVTDSLTVPPDLIRPVCDKWHFDKAPADAHWDGYAVFVWAADESRIVAIDCSLTSVSADFAPLFARFDIDDDAARNLRQFLTANGIEVNWAP